MPALQLRAEGQTTVHHAVNELFALVVRTAGATENEHDNSTAAAYASTAGIHQRTSGLWSSSSVDAAGILAAKQRRYIQIVCAAMASISISAAICAIYWFWTMRRNYRRDLVLMLILGDFYKSLWYLIHGSVNFGRSQVKSGEVFCQVSGFMLQTGLSSCDVAILFISMHMALQIFPPNNSFLGHDGLYKVRHWVFGAWVIIPCLTAALAFINPHGAYQAQGAWCWLPIRPFWYRLALSWVPRYLIWLYIMWVAIRIYSHVGYEFRVFGQERDRSSSTDLSAQSSAERGAIEKAVKQQRAQVVTITTEKSDGDYFAPDDLTAPHSTAVWASPTESNKSLPHNGARRLSLPAWHSPFGGSSTPARANEEGIHVLSSRSNPTSRRGSRQIAPGVIAEDFMAPPNFDASQPRGSISSLGSLPRSLTAPSTEPNLPPIAETAARPTSVGTDSSAASSLGNRAMRQRRRAIQRQLRILFIYPVVYILLWMIPFVVHCMSYSDRFAQHPVFPLSLLSSFCQSFMGFADVCVFCWRERPWRHVAGGDGTFLGSFAFWRSWGSHQNSPSSAAAWARRASRAPSQLPEANAPSSQTGLLSSLKRWSLSRKGSSPNASTRGSSRPRLAHKRTFSGGGEGRKTREAELAHERLKLERQDYERNRGSLDARRESVVSGAMSQGQTPAQAPSRKEWFDQNLSVEFFEE